MGDLNWLRNLGLAILGWEMLCSTYGEGLRRGREGTRVREGRGSGGISTSRGSRGEGKGARLVLGRKAWPAIYRTNLLPKRKHTLPIPLVLHDRWDDA